MNIILLGPPGAGKGTISFIIKDTLSLTHLSSGDMLRDEIKKGTDLGKKAQTYISEGKLVPDEDIIGMILSRIEDAGKGVILDGFPRTVTQAEKLDEAVKIDAVIELSAGLDVIMDRICSRRVCEDCKDVYNVKTHSSDKCDKCGGKLIARADDNPETVEQRYNVYLEQTKPLIDFYHDKGILYTIDGEDDIKNIEAQIIDILK